MRYKSLDLLKFVLAIIIVMHHFQQVTGTKFDSGINFYHGDIYFGYVVEFFFIISGFTMHIDTNKIGGGYLLHKLLRLYPMILVSTGCCILTALVYKSYTGQWYDSMYPSFKLILVSLTATQAYVKSVPLAFNNPTWYIGVLVLCYILYLFGNVLSRKYGYDIVCFYGMMVFAGCFILKFGKKLSVFSFLPHNGFGVGRGLVAFFLGCILMFLYSRYKQKCLYIIAGIMVIACGVFGWLNFSLFCKRQWYLFTFLLFPSILYLTLMCEKLLKGKIWNYLGRISYEMYLWHSVFLMVLMGMVNSLGWSKTFSRGDMLLFVVSMIGFGVLVYKGIELKVKNCLDR